MMAKRRTRVSDRINLPSFTPDEGVTIKQGYYNDQEGFYMEWDSENTFLVVRKDGKDYKQTIDEFISNCKND